MIQKLGRHLVLIIALLVGIVLIGLLFWTNSVIAKQREYYVISEIITDVQVHLSTFHLWLEEFLGGDQAIDINKVWKDYDNVLINVDAALNGGFTEHGPILKPQTDPAIRSHLITLRASLVQFRELAVQRVKDPKTSGIGSGVDHRFDSVFVKILTETSELVDIAKVLAAHDQLTWQQYFMTIGAAWAIILILTVLALRNREMRRAIAEKSQLIANEQLQHQTAELTKHREQLEEIVNHRTKELTSVNESLQLEIGRRTQKEAALKESKDRLRYLSNELLTAQDNERKRLSRELHDELGQSLTSLKLNLRSLQKKLPEDQGAIRVEYDNILQYIDTVIEDVRRLAADLSPYILEDIGLTGALQQLIRNCVYRQDLEFTLDTMNIDHLFSPKAEMHIYRILQEALTNVIKHSGAKTASIVIRSDDEKISFFIKDDGVGFHANDVNVKKGLGLASMNERARMLCGSLELSSALGKGTQIAFAVPTETAAISGQRL